MASAPSQYLRVYGVGMFIRAAGRRGVRRGGMTGRLCFRGAPVASLSGWKLNPLWAAYALARRCPSGV